jgi:tetratricopeptide (TPR) repeat protein
LGGCLYALGIIASTYSSYHEAIQLLEEARQLIGGFYHAETMAGIRIWLGWSYHELGDYDRAKNLYEEAYQISKDQGVGVVVPYALDKLGLWADSTGDFNQGLLSHQEALKAHRILGAQSGQAYALSRMSVSAWNLGDFTKALQYGQEGYDCFKAIGHRWGIAISPSRIGYAELALERYAEARVHFLQGLKSGQEYHMPGPSIYALIGLAMLEARQGEAEGAIEMLTVAINHPITPSQYKETAKKELDLLKVKLGDKKFKAAQARGRALEFQDVIDKLNKP